MRFNPKNSDRNHRDFFPTPPDATVALLGEVCFNGLIWECACGEYHMSNVLEAHGYSVKSTDILYGQDFLKSNDKVNNIVTNPPFSLATEFAFHAKKLASQKICLLLRLAFLESQKRYEFFKDNSFPLSRVLVFSKRIRIANGEINNKGGMVPYAWFVWDKAHIGAAKLGWLNFK